MGRLRKNVEYEQILFNDSFYYVNNPEQFKGNWNNVFNNKNPIEIEIGTGKGSFILQKALLFKGINFVAIDKFPTVLFQLLKKLNKLETPLNNLKIISIDALKICSIFEDKEIDKIYLNFSDPWPKKHHEKFRLTSNTYTKLFFEILKNDGFIEFKTDNDGLFQYTLSKIKENNFAVYFATNNLYETSEVKNNIATEYEIKWIARGSKIKKIIFRKKYGK